MSTRTQNESKYKQWVHLTEGGRRYWYDVPGRHGYWARYVKVVDVEEVTVRFYPEIYNAQGKLIAIHEKYPLDTGHQPVEE